MLKLKRPNILLLLRVKNLARKSILKPPNSKSPCNNSNLLNNKMLMLKNLKDLQKKRLRSNLNKINWLKLRRRSLSLLLNLIKKLLRTRESLQISNTNFKSKRMSSRRLMSRSKRPLFKKIKKPKRSLKKKKLNKRPHLNLRVLRRRLLSRRKLNLNKRRRFMSLSSRNLLKTKTWLVRPTSWMPKQKILRRLSKKMLRCKPNLIKIGIKSLNLMRRERLRRNLFKKQMKNWTKLRKY